MTHDRATARRLAAAWCFLLLAGAAACVRSSGEARSWDEARSVALRSGRPVFLEFSADW